ncbi:hypothetical protein BaRGS_00004857 [Batillaria attramentaria]|uniref:Uncharacterized protein n=1 Tax=Batillaria attramentaria TaxID=370345 RepID=A0ABD0LVR2_9CAEN
MHQLPSSLQSLMRLTRRHTPRSATHVSLTTPPRVQSPSSLQSLIRQHTPWPANIQLPPSLESLVRQYFLVFLHELPHQTLGFFFAWNRDDDKHQM